MMILRNIDFLFEYPHMSAVVSGQTRYPQWKDLNSGLMVIEPDESMHKKLLSLIPQTVKRRELEGYLCGDQDVFHEYMPTWKDKNNLHLDEKYNLFFHDVDYLIRKGKYKLQDMHVIHFAGAVKPWMWSRTKMLHNICRMTVKFQWAGLYFLTRYKKLYSRL